MATYVGRLRADNERMNLLRVEKTPCFHMHLRNTYAGV